MYDNDIFLSIYVRVCVCVCVSAVRPDLREGVEGE